MNMCELLEGNLRYWSRVVGFMYPLLNSKIQDTLNDSKSTEADYAARWREVSSLYVQQPELPPSPDVIPAKYRERGRPDGEVLTTKYLSQESIWDLMSYEITRAWNTRKLTDRIRVGKTYAYNYKELVEWQNERVKKKSQRK